MVAASNPTDVFAMDDLRTIMGRNFIVVVATRTQISSYIGQAFNSGGDAADMAMEASLGFDGSGPEKSVDDIQAVTEEAPIVRYVNLLILQALNERASDVHVEPTATDLRIRYRIDGVLHDVSTAPRAISAAVTTRLKVMADMNVAEHRIPQDGRISLNVGSKGIDLRMATLPTIHGEKVVMRVLDKSSVVLGFADLGFDEDLLKTYESIYTKPYGTILVTGPTGSGKSTTLYTTLTALNSTGEEHHHGGGSCRATAQGRQPGTAQREGRTDLCFCSEVDPAIGPRHRPGRGDPRQGDSSDRHRSGTDRSHGSFHASYEQRRIDSDATDRDGNRAIPRHIVAVRRARPATDPAAVHALQGALRAH